MEAAPGPTAPRPALVTGASSGIGAAIATALARLGWPVVLASRRRERLDALARRIEAAGGRACVQPLDATDPASIDACFAAAEKELGVLEVVVSNAGIGRPARLAEADPEDLRREVTTNLLGPLWVARRALPPLLERGRGDLVFVSSLNAVLPRTYQAGYTASKMGVEGVARVLRLELDGTGVRASVVRPGPTGTEFAAEWGGDLTRRVFRDWQERGLIRDLTWMPPESVAAAVVSVVTAPPGTHLDLVQVVPEGS